MRVEAEQTSRRMFWTRYSLTLALRRRQQEIDAGLSSPADREDSKTRATGVLAPPAAHRGLRV
jgi:hypothetical protein